MSTLFACLTFGLSPFCATATAQEAVKVHDSPPYVSQTWHVENGLPQESIRAITQTRDGYLWVGTGGGLARFDGVRFKVYGLSDGLPALYVRALLEDRRGNLWVGTANGLARLEGSRFKTFSGRDGLAGENINELIEDGEGALWIGTSTGLSRWRDERFSVPDPAISIARALAVDATGALWVAGPSGGLLRWNGEKFVAIDQAPEMRSFRPNRLLKDTAGRIWFAAEGKIFCLDGTSWKAYGTAEGLPNVALLCMAAREDGSLWVGSLDQGVYAIHPGETRFRRIESVDGLLDDAVRVLFEDSEGNLWLGTRDRGLTRLRPTRVATWHIQDESTVTMPFSMTESPDGFLYVSTVGRGLYQLNEGKPSPFLRNELEPYGWRTGVTLATRAGALWFVAGSRLFQWEEGNLRQLLPTGGASSLAEDADGGVWVGTPNGVLRRFKGQTFEVPHKELPAGALTAIVPEKSGALWLGVYGFGVIRLDKGQRTSYGKPEGLRSALVRALHLGQDGVLWIGTEGGGLSRLEHGRISNYGRAEGLPDDTILQILEDDAGDLWLGSYHGVIRLVRQEISFLTSEHSSMLHPRVVGHSEGMRSEQCMSSFGGALKLRDGRLCFATGSGIVVIDPKQNLDSKPPSKVRIEGLKADGQWVPLPDDWLSATDQRSVKPPVVEIGPGKQRLEINYTGLFLGAPERVRFRYRLVGLERDWVEAGEARSANYSHLPPDRYRFEVIAHNGTAVWSDRPVVLDIALRPFFWQTSWFLLCSGLGLMALAVVIVRQVERGRMRVRLQRLELESATERERTRIARDIHDDLGSRLTKISMLTDFARKQATPQHPVMPHLSEIAGTARDMLVRLDETVWVVNPRNDQLDCLAEYLLHYTEDFFRHSQVRCHFKVSDDIPPLPVAAEPRHHVFLAAKEALNNIARHARATEVRLRVEYLNGQFTLTVSDNGCGFEAAECLGRRRGLENMKTRVEALGGRFELQSRPGEGSTVSMSFDVALSLQAKADSSPGAG